MVSQILNFGLPAPIDIQSSARTWRPTARSPTSCWSKIEQIPGTADLRIQQPFDQPKLHIDVDRTKAEPGGLHPARRRQQPAGLAERQLSDLAHLLAESRKSASATASSTQTPQYRMRFAAGPGEHSHHRSPATRRRRFSAASPPSTAASEMAVVSHYNIQPVIDILRLGAGPRSGRRGQRHRSRSSTPAAEESAARLADHRARPDPDHALVLLSACWRAWSSPSCWSTC